MLKNQINMTEGAIFPKLVKFAVPLILSSILQLLFNAADIVVVGRYAGDNSLAAVGSTSSMVNLMVNFFIGLGVGCNVVAANFLGAGKKEELNKTVHTTMVLSLIGGLLLTLLGITFSRQILILMASPENVLPLSTLYLKVFFGGITATLVYNFGAALLRAKGDTKRPLYILLIAGLINVILNLIFVIPLKMDVAGVAFATVLSQIFAAVCVVWILLHEEEEFRLEFKKLRLDKTILPRIIKIGLPAGFQGMLFSFSNMVIQSAVNSFGAVMVAGNSAAQSIEGFIYISMNSFAQGTLTFASQNMGAHKFDRIKKLVLISESSVTVVGLLLGFFVLAFGRSLLGIYSENEAVIDAGMLRLSVILATYFTCGMMDCMASAIRGVGHSLMPMLVTLVGACGLRMVYLFTFFRIERFHTFQSIFYSYPLSWVVTFIFLTISFVWIMRKIEA
ncbi:MATE family efflux transporter [uncultured Treponema sp.]|uniref:MATE family efflux transporter n=1 Tax=uncultured Treponema sp. TaxID=162155 RepID=UPI0025ECDCEF|nr:MATE family efflux transporter [uncultured Treponema sp.]